LSGGREGDMADDVKNRIAAIEARRAERKASTQTARDEQYEKDLVRVDELEAELGDDRVSILTTPSFVVGLPTLVVVSTPAPLAFKRFRQMVRKAGQNIEAIGAARDLLASTCVAYPDDVTYARMKEAWPSVHDNVGLAATDLGELEGKD
jgi:hypothetical protein